MAIILELRGITKAFPGVLANDHIDLQLEEGGILALLGENGAGKTTLMNVLYGLYRPDEGEILVGDKRVVFNSPQDAIAMKIGMIHQHFMLVQAMSVVDNIILGLKSNKVVLDEVSAQKRILELADTYGLEVDPNSYIWQLSVGEQQRVEILKAIYRDASILILDEPTAVLTPSEAKDLFHILRRMKEEGKSIVYISHKLDEVMEISDTISVLRLGKTVSQIMKTDTSKLELARMMVGRDVIFRLSKSPAKTGKPILEVSGISALNDMKVRALKNISFLVKEGEILGVAGVSGNGQRELADVLMGLRKVTSGRIAICGVDVTKGNPRTRVDLGVGFIPEDRVGVGLVMSLPILNNVIMKKYRDFAKGPLLDYTAASEYAARIIK